MAIVYIIALLLLIGALMYSRTWGIVVPIVFMLGYVVYLIVISKHTKAHHKKAPDKPPDTHPVRDITVMLFTLIVIGFATYQLTSSAIALSEGLGISAVIIAFTIIASATSLPDAVVSIVNARKGHYDDAISNVFGSNSFNIFIGLSIPLFLAMIFTGPVEIVFNAMELMCGLLAATIVALLFYARKKPLSKTIGVLFIGLFVVYVLYVVMAMA